MIFHVIRAALKKSASPEQAEAALESWRETGRSVPSVRSWVVGRDLGGEFQYGATFVFDDLDGLFAFLTHPATLRTDLIGLELIENMQIFDISDDDDPELADKIADRHRRRNELSPEVSGLLADVPTYLGAGVGERP
ncbi:stress responsive protein [Paractinoplanes abujensis]|uniref:Antibiotic biosynthesis monooxygenase (ABM) superfamily enzyme n=1 Tax=Paractinoplanes abujensis TaxID=882441 RepID=A0A7W7G0L8_9ACTN|nr:Dabb family protein [Actinoplanes abujensis]MBB4693203.1 antibiotic biosynthesis monooxygenase (ABM) superfamily enzyme [Actinoplanes abujensis]GID24402.1 stress responsive protein [Actinoplanes abujensis]